MEDFSVSDHGSIILVHPITSDAREWIAENVAEDAQMFGDALAVERRFADVLVQGMVNDGLILRKAVMQ